jgi:hypothetical protein
MENNNIPARRSDPYKPRNIGWLKIKSFTQEKIRKYSAIYTFLGKIWRIGRFIFLKSKWKLDSVLGSWRGIHIGNIDVDKIYWISPQKIVFSSLQYFDLQDFKGHILGGDWDRLEKRFDTIDLYIAIKQVCMEGKIWTDTVYYQRVLNSLKKGQFLVSYQNEKDLSEHCKKTESLYRNIQSEGYKSQKELFLAGQIQDPMVAEEEIAVSIGRFGDLLFSDGAHRLSIAKLLKVPVVPVKITVRHKDWIEFRNELRLYGKQSSITKDGKLYQPATHPDLSGLPAQHKCEDWFQLIKDNTSFKQGLLLDIGANLGYFCHRFEEMGLDCYAIENDPVTASFLKRLARAENRKFKIIAESFLNSSEIRNTRFNIVLALHIFHHFLKTQEGYEKLVDFLRNLQTDELFLETYFSDESQMQDTYKNYSPEEFVKFVLENSKLKTTTLLGVMQDGRSLYKLC